MLRVTVGRGLTAPQGKALDVVDVADLARLLESQPPTVEAWWSPHLWRDDKRAANGWGAAAGIGVDVDFYASGRHATLPADTAEQLQALAASGKVVGNLFHLTPRGCRFVVLFPELCTDRDAFKAAALEAGRRIGEVLKRNLPDVDLRVDEGVLLDLARLLYAPNAIVKGSARSASVITVRQAPTSLGELVAPAAAEPAWSVVELPGNATISDAVRRYNAEHAREFPRGRGKCPVCGHNGCFGAMRDDPAKWSCFSANHSGAGRQAQGCYVGDVLDLDAHAAGQQPIDFLRAQGYLAQRATSAAPTASAPVTDLTPATRPLTKSYASACYILRSAQLRELVLGPGALEFNEQTLTPTLDRKPFTDALILTLRERCENLLRSTKGRPLEFSRDTLEQAVLQVAHEKPYQPVRDYLRSLRWDGVERIDHLAEDALNISPTVLQRSILRKWMISTVARPLRPGCKVDNVLILVGGQGVKKSTFFATLGGEWHRDSMMDLQSKDAYQMLRSAWIFEWSELESMTRSRDASTVKAFITSRVDSYRPAYARAVEEHPRTCVIVGSTNDDRFLADPTGNRRFWVVPAPTDINVDVLAATRDQLWAEAVAMFDGGESWWLERNEEGQLAASQDGYVIRDPWEEIVVDYVEAQHAKGHVVTTGAILSDAIEKRTAQQEKGDEMRVAAILRRAGFERARVYDSFGRQVRGWVRSR